MQYALKRSFTGIPFTVLTAVVFLTPVLMQITGSNYVKLIEDVAYLLMLLVSVNVIVRRNISFVVSKTTIIFIAFIAVFTLIGMYYSGISMIMLQFRQLKYLLLPIILLPYTDPSSFKNVWAILKVIAALCIPVSLIQWIIFKSDGDSVTGLLGYGGSGTLTLFCLIVFFSELGMRFIENKRILGLYVLFIIPTALNETKLTVILFPVMSLMILIFAKKIKFKYIIYMIIAIAGMLAGWTQIYKQTYGNSLFQVFSSEYVEKYLFATNWVGDAGRFAKVIYAFDLINNNNFFFGYGLGASYEGISSGVRGYIYNKFYSPEMFDGTRLQLFISLIDTGVIGSILILLIVISFFIKVIRTKNISIEKIISVNTFIVIIVAFIYQSIFYTSQIMFIFLFYTFLCLRFNIATKNSKGVNATNGSVLSNT